MENVNLVYIDDDPDNDLSYYLNKIFRFETVTITFKQVKFNNTDGYESLLTNTHVRSANIIVIDSRLFENENVIQGKFSGEEFMLILKNEYPFIEVLIVTQNKTLQDANMVSKYKGRRGEDPVKYYEQVLKDKLEESIKNVLIYRGLSKRLNDNSAIGKTLIEKISNSLDGIKEYDELKKKDIDEIVNLFKEIQRGYND